LHPIGENDVRGQKSPYFVNSTEMIEKEYIKNLVSNYLEQNSLFLVDVENDKENNIEVTIESNDSTVVLEDCVNVSHIIDKGLDREKEDYSLTVTSAGLDRPFKVLRQYQKYSGKDVDIVMKNGEKLSAVIISAEEAGIEVALTKLVKLEGKKRKEKQELREFIKYSEMKSVKPKITI